MAAGVYSLLPLGHRVIQKIKRIIREELDGIGGLELTMPVFNPAELCEKDPPLFRYRRRTHSVQGPQGPGIRPGHDPRGGHNGHSQAVMRSYRDLPVMLYQIQTKIRDEARPRAGLLRVREFFMKDAYSFHRDFEDLDAYYPRIYNAYLRFSADAA